MAKIDHKFPEVDAGKCIGCGACVSVCPQTVFEMKGSKSKVMKPENCVECNACVENCPSTAIKLVGPK
jgi:NAD-dependent dihydropyrimidine dehydrogenase PreA subunit